MRPAVAALAVLCMLLAAMPLRAAASCAGDCDGGGSVSVDELVRAVGLALGAPGTPACAAADGDGDGVVRIAELIAAVAAALDGCVVEATPTDTASPTQTATPEPSKPTASPTAESGVLAIAAAIARDAQGRPQRLGERVTVEGIATVGAGVFANNKLKLFIQDETGAAIQVFHETSSRIDAYQRGDRLRVTGVIRFADPGGGSNPATGTTMVDVSNGAWELLGSGSPLPAPLSLTAAALVADGNPLVGRLVQIAGLRKVSGAWPLLGSRSTQVTVGDDAGTQLVMRLQRNVITAELIATLAAIGDGELSATAIVIQDDNNGLPLIGSYELWPRAASDIAAAPGP